MYANAHVVNLAEQDPQLAEALAWADCVYADGVSVALACRLLSGLEWPGRMTAADFAFFAFQRFHEANLKMFLLGGVPGAAERTAEQVERRWKGLISGFHHGYFGMSAEPAIVQKINDSGASILLVGMGSPRQEVWIRQHASALRPAAIWAVGALIEQLAGFERRSPRLLCRIGCEWLWRLAVRPDQRWRRYIIGNPRFVWTVWRQRLRGLQEPVASAGSRSTG